jgi:uncharacterized protein
MPAKTNLHDILRQLGPELLPTSYVFCTLANGRYGDFQQTSPLACIQESEGLSLVLPKTQADAHALPYEGIFRCISLRVHSSLQSVGLSAAIAQCLADAAIGVNIIAGFHHDHLLVPAERATEALGCIERLGRDPADPP